MLVLGIESSCDETAAAVVEDGARILSNVVASQVLTHAKYGGVVPELASREHLRRIVPVVDEACRRAAVELEQVDAVAVTEGPGLIGSLLVGLVYGKALALALRKPLVGVNHLEGHIHAVLLEYLKTATPTGAADAAPSLLSSLRRGPRGSEVDGDWRELFPNVTLVVSGGHTSLFYVTLQAAAAASTPDAALTPDALGFSYRRLGQTRDDAAGEAFDKVAKLLALGYPGGPVIDRLAPFGNPHAVDFGRIRMKGNPYDFSFSGLKTAVLYRVRGTPLAAEAEERRAWLKGRAAGARPSVEEFRAHSSQATLDMIASFQEAVVTDLVDRTQAAASAERARTVFVSGGVACNSLLRRRFSEAGATSGVTAYFPSLDLSTDNAAMIAAAGYHRLQAGHRAGQSLTAHASFPLGL